MPALDQRNQSAGRLIGTDGLAFGLNVIVDREISIGRDGSNEVILTEGVLSRHHCVLRPLPEGGIEVRDLGSVNGTFVSGQRIERRILAHRDRLTVGGSTFLVILDDQPPAQTSAAELEDDGQIIGGTIQLRPEDALLLRAPLARERDTAPPLADALGAVLRIAESVTAASSADDLQERVAAQLLDVVPAD